jgi:hypothetical protein
LETTDETLKQDEICSLRRRSLSSVAPHLTPSGEILVHRYILLVQTSLFFVIIDRILSLWVASAGQMAQPLESGDIEELRGVEFLAASYPPQGRHELTHQGRHRLELAPAVGS